jgi:hypothetical protein
VNEKLSDGRHKQPRIAGLKVVNHKKLHDWRDKPRKNEMTLWLHNEAPERS